MGAKPSEEKQINLHNQPCLAQGSWFSRFFSLLLTGRTFRTMAGCVLHIVLVLHLMGKERNPRLCNNNSILILPGLHIGEQIAEWLVA